MSTHTQTHPPAGLITVELNIENIYPDQTVTTSPAARVTPPCGWDEASLDQWAADRLFTYTGTGRNDDESGYTITITAADDDRLTGRTFEFMP